MPPLDQEFVLLFKYDPFVRLWIPSQMLSFNTEIFFILLFSFYKEATNKYIVLVSKIILLEFDEREIQYIPSSYSLLSLIKHLPRCMFVTVTFFKVNLILKKSINIPVKIYLLFEK